ncbi:asparaginase [Candidatus Cyanaurora vandensis]|uniref:asparaginase n=1 Tax=Candidatus Cyanaurora vandensis TaxID=2714958 RepID=UPI00257F4770|nr:asparaginase [Candidatus Cyanaurora vandensis]
MERYKTSQPVFVQLLREGLVESVHQVHVVVTDTRGRVLAQAGDANLPVFARSALKPFQALAVLRAGVQLAEPGLATLCSSHNGDIQHCREVFNLLWQADLDASNLACPVPAGTNSVLAHNCSGKHAGMLLACQAQGWPLPEYTNPRHPLQQFIGKLLSELLGLPMAELIVARDDCGAPTYQVPLSQLARLYARLSGGEYAQMEAIARAMTNHPGRVAGVDRFDTLLMEMTQDLVSKGGAEGVQCIAGRGMGLAVKVTDGAERAKYPVVIHLLRQLGWLDPSAAQTLWDRFTTVEPYKRLELLGDLEII